MSDRWKIWIYTKSSIESGIELWNIIVILVREFILIRDRVHILRKILSYSNAPITCPHTRRLTKHILFTEQEIVYSADTFNNQSDDEDWDWSSYTKYRIVYSYMQSLLYNPKNKQSIYWKVCVLLFCSSYSLHFLCLLYVQIRYLST